MPAPVCHECANEVKLDTNTCWKHSVQVNCSKCKTRSTLEEFAENVANPLETPSALRFSLR